MTYERSLIFEFGPFRMDSKDGVLLREGRPVPLSPKAFEALVILVKQNGHLVEKDELLKTLWPDTFVEEANLSRQIWILRKALGEDRHHPQYIETVPKRGYRFVADVSVVPEPAHASELVATRVISVPADLALGTGKTTERSPDIVAVNRRRLLAPLIYACVAVAVFIGLTAGLARFWRARQSSAVTKQTKPLPKNLTRLTNHVAKDAHPSWSPDATRVVFTSNRDGKYAIYTMAANGESLLKLTASGANDTQPASSPNGERIAFVSDEQGSDQIYVMNADGTGRKRLTETASNSHPAWSPDGTRLAFVSQKGDLDEEICVMDADGTRRINLSNNPARDMDPAWSPDGKTIAFTSNRDQAKDARVWFTEIYVMKASGGAATRLTYNTPGDDRYHPTDESMPAWSPDGRKIAFISDRDSVSPDAGSRLYVVDNDGGNLMRVTANRQSYSEPAWCPDGRRIAFVGNNDGNLDIFTVSAVPGNPIRLTENPADDLNPDWSPDGARIAFVSNRDGKQAIYVMNADGSGVARLTETSDNAEPAWSPDGSKIAFVSCRDGNNEVYVMNADGSGQTNITRNPAYDSRPAWLPDGRRIAFLSSRAAGPDTYAMYVANSDGSNPVLISAPPFSDFDPSFSPDGSKVAFMCARNAVWNLCLKNTDGTGEIFIARPPVGGDHIPVWSRDGRTIAFVSTRDHNEEIYTIRPNGSELTRLTFERASDTEPSWSPDGKRIVFNSARDGNYEIYIIEVEND